MSDAVAQFHAALGAYSGYVIAAGAPAAVLLLNQVIFHHRWKSYPTLAQYSAAHPNCIRAEGVVCHGCGTKGARADVSGRGDIYRCSWCETELFRIDKVEGEGVR